MKTFDRELTNVCVENIRNIYKFKDGSLIRFNKGKFDDYQVTYIPNENEISKGYSPFDTDYFEDLMSLISIIGRENVWDDFSKISDSVIHNGTYNKGRPKYDKTEVIKVKKLLGNLIIQKYPHEFQQDVFKLYLVIWSVMISEWYHPLSNEKLSLMKHSLKILGFYQVYNNLLTPLEAAKFSENIDKIDEFLMANLSEFDLDKGKGSKLIAILKYYDLSYNWIFSGDWARK